ncbi:MAG: penicillin-binding transpeptidase domain-containing protein [Longimicrobiaceae bacterium]
MTDTLLVWITRALLIALGLGAFFQLLSWLRWARQERRERWTVLVGAGMVILALVYALGHARLLGNREEIEEGRMRYSRWGDARLAEQRWGEVRGWLLGCGGGDDDALASYALREGMVERVYPLQEATANLIGTPEGERDYTVERLYASRLRETSGWSEEGRLHPAGTDLRLALCADASGRAWELLRQTGRQGALIALDVRTGEVVAYAATGEPEDPPLGIQRYAAPGSVFKLALAALWWELGLPDKTIPCPSEIRAGNRSISNYQGRGYGSVEGPAGMLRISCNTAAVSMALEMRERFGVEPFEEHYPAFGFEVYSEEPPGDDDGFWRTTSERWRSRMTPPPARIRMSPETSGFEWGLLGIGQGPVDVTVIHLARFLQAIGNGGVMLAPTLEWELARQAEKQTETETEPAGTRVMSPETSHRLQAAMLEVVRSGTARSVADRLEGTGWSLGGKTGTAQVFRQADDGWFGSLLFDPSGQARYAVIAYLVGGGPGGRQPAAAAAGLARSLVERERAEGSEEESP